MAMSEPKPIFCLTCNEPLDLGGPGQCAHCGRAYDPIRQHSVNATGKQLGPWTRWFLRAPPWPSVVVASMVMLQALWPFRMPRATMQPSSLVTLELCCSAPVWLLILMMPRLSQLAWRSLIESRLGLPRKVLQTRHPFWPYLVVIALMGYVAVEQHIPFKVATVLSEHAFDELADAALADPKNVHELVGRRAGLYSIAGVEIIGNSVVLYVGRDRGNYGFVRVPNAPADIIFNEPRDPDNPAQCNDFPKTADGLDPYGKRIFGDWFVMYSFYWSIKDGWSCNGNLPTEFATSSASPARHAWCRRRRGNRRHARVAFAGID
jgi:hypothetical protein